MRLRSYGVCEHVCRRSCTRRSCTRRLRLNEERHERCSIGPQGLVIPDEETTCVRCLQQVEGASNMRLIAEARAMIERGREPVVSRQCRCISCGKVAEVVVGHADDACRVDGYRGCEGGPAGDLADHGRRGPGLAAVGGCGDYDLVDGSPRESIVRPD